MAVFLITYDLNNPGQDYNKLFQAIKTHGKWSHRLDSTWIIETSSSLKTVADDLVNHIDKNDKLIVIEVKDNYSGWMVQAFWDWMSKLRF